MANKQIVAELVIKGVDQYSGMVKNMSGVTGRFATSVRNEMARLQGMRGPLRMIEDFKAAQSTFGRSEAALRTARQRVAELRREMRATEAPTKQMVRDFNQAQRAAERLRIAHEKNSTELTQLRGKLQSAGVNTGNLASEQQRLASRLSAANDAFARQAERMQRLKVMQDKVTAGRQRMDRALARSANLNFVGSASTMTGRRMVEGFSAPIMQAVEFESAMSDVRKVVDFESPAAFRDMSEDILEMSTRIPMAATALASITAAGGQAGIPEGELTRFAEMAAKIGVAFDISADHAGTFMAKTKTAMGLTLTQTGSIFDAMNHLSNKSAARADQTMDFLNRAGADGANFGFDSTETLAIGAAMIASGAGADTAATSFRNMGRALVRGTSATDRQSGAMSKLGLNSAAVARAMQQDAVGTTTDVLERLNNLPDHVRASVMSDLFGDEARELTKLLNNMQLMPDMLALVADETDYLGSAQAEYDERSKTTANNMQLMRNQVARLGITIGEVVLPPFNEFLTKSQDIVETVTKWSKEHPKLTKWLVVSGIALGGLAVAGGVMLTAAAGLIGTLAVLRFGLVGLGARAVFAGGGLARLGTRYAALGRMPRLRLSRLAAPLRWTASLLPVVPWRRLAGPLRLATLVAPLRWVGTLVPSVPWRALAGSLRLSSLIAPLRWAAGLIPAIGWRSMVGGLSWSSLIRPLVWLGRGALRFIPVIGWASLAGELLWNFLIKPLGWDKYLPKIDWSYWFSFEWIELLPEWNWDFIPEINLSDWISWPEPPAWFSGTGGTTSVGSAGRQRSRDNRIQTPIGQAREVTPLAGARATGGAIMAGKPYLAGERGPEPIFSSRNAYVATNQQMQRIQGRARSARAATLAAVAASAAIGSASPLAAGSGAPGADGKTISVQLDIGHLSITAPSGVSDPEGLVDVIEARLGDRIAGAIAASFSD